MYDRDYILSVLKEKAIEYRRVPRWGLPKELFEFRSYHNWAVDELLDEIASSDKDPMEVTTDFVNRMVGFACDARTDSAKFMFSTALDAGEWILDILCELEEQRRSHI